MGQAFSAILNLWKIVRFDDLEYLGVGEEVVVEGRGQISTD